MIAATTHTTGVVERITVRSLAILHALAMVAIAVDAFAADVPATAPGYAVTTWAQKDGVPPGTIWSLAQDRDGYIWIGADAGLLRFDGVRIQPWSELGAPPLPRSTVRVVRPSRSGGLWLAYADRAAISFVSGTQVVTYTADDGAPGVPTLGLVEDADGTVWATSPEGVHRFEAQRWQRATASGLTQAPTSAITLDRRGGLTIASTEGVVQRQAGAANFVRLAGLEAPLLSLVQDDRGRIVVSDPTVGFRVLDGNQWLRPEALVGRGTQLLIDRLGGIWLGTTAQGIWRIPALPPHTTPTAVQVAASTVEGAYALLEDREGNIWAGGADGLHRITPHKVTPIADLGLIRSVTAANDGSVWASTNQELLQLSWTGSNWRLLRRTSVGAAARVVLADSEAGLWVGTSRGLLRIEPGSLRQTLVSTTAVIDALASDRRGGVWFHDAARGIVHLTSAGEAVFPLPPDLQRFARLLPVRPLRVLTMLTDASARVWIAFVGGDVLVLGPDGSRKRYGPESGLDIGAVVAMSEDDDGTMWLAGARGLARVRHEDVVALGPGGALPLEALTAIVPDAHGQLWVGTGAGIVRFRKADVERAQAGQLVPYTVLDRDDGVAGVPNWFSNAGGVRSTGGILWFVTSRGLTVVDPTLTDQVSAPVPARIEAVRADRQLLSPSDDLSLPPGVGRVEIEYTALTLTSPMRSRFRYRLDGLDTQWVSAGTRRQATYTNLRPGNYVFRVQTRRDTGDWNIPGSSLRFSIQPAFYQTTWFTILLAGSGGLAILAVWRLRLRQLRRQFAMLLQERVRLSRELHDTLLQGLVGVALQVDAIANDAEKGDAPVTSDRFVRLRQQVESYVREARQSIWDLRSGTIEHEGLPVALRQAAEHALRATPVALHFVVEGTPPSQALESEHELLRIGQEAVLNAARHARASRVDIRLTYSPATVCLQVTDDGCGFDVQAVDVDEGWHYGLTTMRERAESAGGTLKVTSGPGGTTVDAAVPLRRRA
jgi:signal transduction histidine kinase